MLMIKKLNPEMPTPKPATRHAACLDICADLSRGTVVKRRGSEHHCLDDVITLCAGERAMIKTGLAMACAEDEEIQVRPRSGLAWKHGVTVLNAPGTIDSDYRGEICVILLNTSSEPFVINHGDRIAQICVKKVEPTVITFVDELPDYDSNRDGGFGSTGVK